MGELRCLHQSLLPTIGEFLVPCKLESIQKAPPTNRDGDRYKGWPHSQCPLVEYGFGAKKG